MSGWTSRKRRSGQRRGFLRWCQQSMTWQRGSWKHEWHSSKLRSRKICAERYIKNVSFILKCSQYQLKMGMNLLSNISTHPLNMNSNFLFHTTFALVPVYCRTHTAAIINTARAGNHKTVMVCLSYWCHIMSSNCHQLVTLHREVYLFKYSLSSFDYFNAFFHVIWTSWPFISLMFIWQQQLLYQWDCTCSAGTSHHYTYAYFNKQPTLVSLEMFFSDGGTALYKLCFLYFFAPKFHDIYSCEEWNSRGGRRRREDKVMNVNTTYRSTQCLFKTLRETKSHSV